jgi:hypothetical protein
MSFSHDLQLASAYGHSAGFSLNCHFQWLLGLKPIGFSR